MSGNVDRIHDDLMKQKDVLENETLFRLRKRIEEVDFWHSELSKSSEYLRTWEAKLLVCDSALDKALQEYKEPATIADQCLTLRAKRLGSENVDDAANEKLREEISINANCVRILKEEKELVCENLRRVRAVKYEIDRRAKQTLEGKKCEERCLSIPGDHVADVFEDAKKWIPNTSRSDEIWRAEIDDLCKKSIQLGQQISEIIKSCDTKLAMVLKEIRAAFDRTQTALQARTSLVTDAIDKLKKQHEHICKQRNEIIETSKQLEEQKHIVNDPMHKAHARMSQRNERPASELMNDKLQIYLAEQLAKWKSDFTDIDVRIEECGVALRNLNRQMLVLEEDIHKKMNAVYIDAVQCRELRSFVRLISPYYKNSDADVIHTF